MREFVPRTGRKPTTHVIEGRKYKALTRSEARAMWKKDVAKCNAARSK